MAAHPIILLPEMVRVILDSKKKQTLRLLGLKAYKPGDTLWVRECFWQKGIAYSDGSFVFMEPTIGYRDDYADYGYDKPSRNGYWKRREAVHMPRWASRITLEIVRVRDGQVWAIRL